MSFCFSNKGNRKQKFINLKYSFLTFTLDQSFQMMDKVSIINFNLHKRYVVEKDKNFISVQQFNKSTPKERLKQPSESQTIKKLVKKGLVHYTNPFNCSKSSQPNGKQNISRKQLQQPHERTLISKTLFSRKQNISSSLFMCTRNHKTGQRNSLKNQRVITQSQQNNDSFASYFHKKRNQAGWQDMNFSDHAFREFRNISEQTMSKMNVENERRNFKLHKVHKSKYEQQWKRYPVPLTSKQKYSVFVVSRITT